MKRMVIPVILVAMLLMGAEKGVARQKLQPLTGSVRIMFVGDSTASGQPVACGDGSHYGDRQVLGDWLSRVGGVDVHFVGSWASSCGAPWNRHQGLGGETIVGLTGKIRGYLAVNPADILILRIGVNDATSTSGWKSAVQMAADYALLLDAARAQSPTIRIIASEIIPPDGGTNADLARASVTAQEFNSMLPVIVAPYGDSVHIVHNGIISPIWLADGLHPSGEGYVGMSWFLTQQPGGLWPWVSDRPAPRTKPWGLVTVPCWGVL